jgi:DNA invertase Pin-like site-specific DNA recombinase
MTANQFVPAAQYVRMSTEHQQYSLENQSTAIQTYAESNGFEVVRTYSDAAKSGLVLRHRIGLRQLLHDVVAGSPAYRVILVYDVSRWGRFQDTDESAHYEFLCKSAGVPVHYCAETFANDGTLPSLIMKALKRTMAGEYSRELGVKVLAGLKRLASLGFKQGGMPGYGLRRMLVSPAGVPKQVLASGERKGIATDRVILVPGPTHEVQCVKDIFRMLVSEKRTVYAIARELNRRDVAYIGGTKWDYQAVYNVLTHPKYAGCHVFGRTSSRLYTPTVKLSKSEWILKHEAFEPIIDPVTFAAAQKILEERTFNKTDEQLLDSLRALLASERRLSLTLIQNSANVPSPSTYRNRFGSLRRAYELVGYGHPDQFGPLEMRRRTQALRQELVAKIASTFPNEISIVKRGGRWRSRLRLSNGLIVSVLVARSVRAWKETLRWQIDPVQHERKFMTILSRLDASNCSFLDLHVFPNIDRRTRFRISLSDSWLNRGKRLSELSRLCEVVARVRRAWKGKPRKLHGCG